MKTVDICVIILYHIGILSVGIHAKNRVRSVDDFLVAGNRFSAFSLTGTIVASLIGAGMTMGVVGKVTQYGSGILWNFFGFAAGLTLFAVCFVPGIRKTQKRTMAEIIAGRFGRMPRMICGIFAAVYAYSIMIIGITGMARLITYVFESSKLIVVATVFSTAVAIVLTTTGGLYSVIWTDTLQFVLMVVMIMVLAPSFAIKNAGSLCAINSALSNAGGSLTDCLTGVPLKYVFSSFFVLCFAEPGDPTVPQRALAGKNEQVVRRAFLLSALFAILFGYAMTIVGGGMIILMPDIEETYGTSEAVLPAFIINYFPPILAGLGISALIATIITTITSMLLVGTTHLIYDVGQSIFPTIPDYKFKKIIPVAIAVTGIIVMWLSLKVESIGNVVYFALSLCGAFLFPMIGSLYWKKISKWGVSLGVLTGGLVIIGMYAMGVSGLGGDPIYLGLMSSFIFTIVPSLIENKLKYTK